MSRSFFRFMIPGAHDTMQILSYIRTEPPDGCLPAFFLPEGENAAGIESGDFSRIPRPPGYM
jgi:hypothetical protein